MLRLQPAACGNGVIAVGTENIENHARLPHFQSHRHGWIPALKDHKISLETCTQTQRFATGDNRIQPHIWKPYPSASLDNLSILGRTDVNMLQVLVLGGLALVLLYRVGLGHVGRRAPGLPPGPPTLPLIGNPHQLPLRHLYRQFSKWAQEYGPVYSLILGTKVFIIISSDHAAKDLLVGSTGSYLLFQARELYWRRCLQRRTARGSHGMISGSHMISCTGSLDTFNDSDFCLERIAIWRDLADNSQDRPSYFQRSRRAFLCPLPGPRKRSNAPGFPRETG